MRNSRFVCRVAVLVVASALCQAGAAHAATVTDSVPSLDHVVVIVMENKTYDQARGEAFTASLITQSSSFTQSHALTHPSQPNYLALWSGSSQGVTNNDCPPPGSPFTTNNLGHACEAAGIAWKAYCESLPSVGSSICSDPLNLYVRRHCPWTHFSNLNHANEVPFTQLAVDESLGTMPRLAFVIPNDCDNTHDCATSVGDAWLSNQVPRILGAIGTNGVLIITWDEDDGSGNNRILTVFTGQRVSQGYTSSTAITHYTVLRTICAALGLQPFGAAAGENPIANIWTAPVDDVVSVASSDELRLSAPVPNPSRGGVSAKLDLPQGPNRVEAAVYDIGGRRVADLQRGTFSGVIRLAWDGRDRRGRRSSPGVYVLQVRANSTLLQRRFARVP